MTALPVDRKRRRNAAPPRLWCLVLGFRYSNFQLAGHWYRIAQLVSFQAISAQLSELIFHRRQAIAFRQSRSIGET